MVETRQYRCVRCGNDTKNDAPVSQVNECFSKASVVVRKIVRPVVGKNTYEEEA